MRASPHDSPRFGFLAGLRRLGYALLRLPRLVRALLCVSWMGLIWALGAQTFQAPKGPPGFWRIATNLAHAPLFAILALFAAAFALSPQSSGGERRWPRVGAKEGLAILGVTILWAFVDEWHQSLVPGRDPSAFDLLTDFAGAACVLWVVGYLGREAASEQGLRWRLLGGSLVCLASASLVSVVGAR